MYGTSGTTRAARPMASGPASRVSGLRPCWCRKSTAARAEAWSTPRWCAEELGRAVNPGPFASTAVGAAGLLADLAAAEQQATYLPAIADGTSIATVALLEPGRRAQWTDPTTTASPTKAAAGRSPARRSHVGDLMAADLVLVIARAGDALGVFAVDTAAATRRADHHHRRHASRGNSHPRRHPGRADRRPATPPSPSRRPSTACTSPRSSTAWAPRPGRWRCRSSTR